MAVDPLAGDAIYRHILYVYSEVFSVDKPTYPYKIGDTAKIISRGASTTSKAHFGEYIRIIMAQPGINGSVFVVSHFPGCQGVWTKELEPANLSELEKIVLGLT